MSDVNGLGGSVMRGGLDGSGVRQVIHIDKPSGVAVDVSRQALYATSRVRGAPIFHSTYDGMWRKQIGRELFFEPRGLAVDPTDGSVVVVEFDTFAKGCDPLYQGGYGAFTCGKRNLGRISRVSCAWTADSTIDGRPPARSSAAASSREQSLGMYADVPAVAARAAAARHQLYALAAAHAAAAAVDAAAAAAAASRRRACQRERGGAPQPVRDYSRMPPIIDDETLVFVGGFVVSGTKAISWGTRSRSPSSQRLVGLRRRLPVLGRTGRRARCTTAGAPRAAAAPPASTTAARARSGRTATATACVAAAPSVGRDRGEIEQSGRWLPLLSARQLRDARGLYHVHHVPQGQLLR